MPLSGRITATGTLAALGKLAAIASLTITGGDLLSDVRTLGAIGAVSVKASKLGLGGSLNTASILAAKIASITVAKNITDSILLAGATFGADGALGGGDDTFATGKIGAIAIGGNVTESLIGAGYSSTNATFGDGDDTILGGIASSIAKLIIKGTADPDSRFAAGKFTAAPKIGTATITPSTDARFLIV